MLGGIRRGALWFAVVVVFCANLLSVQMAAAQSSAARTAGELTVDRIYGQPSLGGHLTRGIAWLPDSGKLSYLETKGTGQDAKTELWTLDAATGERMLLISAEKWEGILPAAPAKQPASQATGLGRRAPAQYQWSPAGNALLVEGATALGWFELKSQTGKVLASGKQAIADPKVSPDGRFVSFVRDHNLWLVSTVDGKERALTTGGSEEIRKGELDWVYPEELDISTAYWWSPDSASIAFLEMDERKVTQFPMLDFASYTGEAELQRYPVAGGANPIVRVFVAPVAGGQPRQMDTGAETNIYIPRVNWLPDSKRVAIQRLNRAQTELDVLLADSSAGKSTVLLTEKDPYWINVSDDLYFFHDGSRFLWSSERSGYRHLYLYDLSGRQLAQLSRGEWEVVKLDRVDEEKRLVYFTATEKSPVERHLYRVSLDGSGFTRLTREAGTHSVQFARNAGSYEIGRAHV